MEKCHLFLAGGDSISVFDVGHRAIEPFKTRGGLLLVIFFIYLFVRFSRSVPIVFQDGFLFCVPVCVFCVAYQDPALNVGYCVLDILFIIDFFFLLHPPFNFLKCIGGFTFVPNLRREHPAFSDCVVLCFIRKMSGYLPLLK